MLPPLEDLTKDIEQRLMLAQVTIRDTCERYVKNVIDPDEFGTKTGPFHAASILSWTRIAELAGVPHIPAQEEARINIKDAWRSIDVSERLTVEGEENLLKAVIYAEKGNYWRTDLCASEFVKHELSQGRSLPDFIPFHLDDPRIMDLHTCMPYIKVVGRPRRQPMLVNGYPVEFRIFIGGKVTSYPAASFYYPQTPSFEPTKQLEGFMEEAIRSACVLEVTRQSLGLMPWLPEGGDPGEPIGSTIDFLVARDGEVLMVDAGPGFGYGAHPCCFLDVEVKGKRWAVDPGVEIR